MVWALHTRLVCNDMNTIVAAREEVVEGEGRGVREGDVEVGASCLTAVSEAEGSLRKTMTLEEGREARGEGRKRWSMCSKEEERAGVEHVEEVCSNVTNPGTVATPPILHALTCQEILTE